MVLNLLDPLFMRNYITLIFTDVNPKERIHLSKNILALVSAFSVILNAVTFFLMSFSANT